MNPYISGNYTFRLGMTSTKIKISQNLLGVVRDFKFFCRENYWPVNLGIIISANRPAESAIFLWKTKKKLSKMGKNSQKVGVHNLAGNSRFHKILLKTYSLVSWDLLWWILDHYIIFISFGGVINFGEKIENFSKIRLGEIFQL